MTEGVRGKRHGAAVGMTLWRLAKSEVRREKEEGR
jgi:hypothetical protein